MPSAVTSVRPEESAMRQMVLCLSVTVISAVMPPLLAEALLTMEKCL